MSLLTEVSLPTQVIMNCQQQSPTPTGFRFQFLTDQFSRAILFLSNRNGVLVGPVSVLQLLALCLNFGSFLNCKRRYLYYGVDIVTISKQLLSCTIIFKENISFHTRTGIWKAFLFVCVQILGGNPGHCSRYTGALPVSSVLSSKPPGVWYETLGTLIIFQNEQQAVKYPLRFNILGRSLVL